MVRIRTATFTAAMAGDAHKSECTAMAKFTLAMAGERRRSGVMEREIFMSVMAGVKPWLDPMMVLTMEPQPRRYFSFWSQTKRDA